MSKTVGLSYEINCQEYGINHEYFETFVPFSNSMIKSSPFLDYIGKEFAELFDKPDLENFELPDFDMPEYKEDFKEQLNIMPDILLDLIYCFFALDKYDSYDWWFDEIFSHSVFLRELLKEVTVLPTIFDCKRAIYVGLYTELVKHEIREIKYIVSALINIYNSNDIYKNENLVNQFLKKIKSECGFGINDIVEPENKKSIQNTMLFLCCYRNFQATKSGFKIEIDMSNFDRFISLLKKYRPYYDGANFDKGYNCFCMAKRTNSLYFSLSGYQEYTELANKIENDLISYYENYNINYCARNNEMLSYGYENIFGKFTKFSTPLRFKDALNAFVAGRFDSKDLHKYYSCCERKILANTKDELRFYCKYLPCKNCAVALQNNRVINFFALSKSPKHLGKILKRAKYKLIKYNKLIQIMT